MKDNVSKVSCKRGFTLIELLVVVLIIGILAAVAVPQYQKAVLKSRMSELLTLQKSVADAQHVYFLANGTYPEHFSQLDLDIDNLTASNDSQLSGIGLASNEDVVRHNNFFQIKLTETGNIAEVIVGKYKGCGVFMHFKSGTKICQEWFYWYKEPAGSFCHKIMGTGETFTTANNVRYFPM